MSSASSPRPYLPEDVEFYTSQTRLCKYAEERIERSGYSSVLYVPPGGWRRGLDDERSKDPYPNQRLAALRIFYEFYCNPTPCVLILLAALFQGGKTGVLQALTRLVMTNADKLYNKWGISVITAMSDVSWIKQTKERLLTELNDQIYHLPTIPKLQNDILSRVESDTYAKNILIIDDESRVGSKNTHTKGDLLTVIKTSSPYTTWKERNIRYLFVDATDPACALNIATMKRQGLATSIRLELPPSYLSIDKLKSEGRLHKALDLKQLSNVEKFKQEIQHFYTTRVLRHIIRMPALRGGGYEKAKANIEMIFGSEFNIIEWNSEIKGAIDYDDEEYEEDEEREDINSLLMNPPEKPTIILIKNMFYAGKTLIDTHVGAMYDRYSERDDVTGQSFAGRASGHGRSKTTRVWTNLEGIDRLMSIWKNIIQMDDELAEPTLPVANSVMNRRMPHIEVTRPLGSDTLMLRTSGLELSRQENLENREVLNLPTRLKPVNMIERGPFPTPQLAIAHLNTYYQTSKLKCPRAKVNLNHGGFHLNSRLLSWYRRQYSDISTSKDLKAIHKLTKEQFDSISITFGCSSRKGQPYVLYPVYPNSDSLSNTIQWYVRYVKREFTKFGRAPSAANPIIVN